MTKEPMAEIHETKEGLLRRSDMTLRDYFAGQALAGFLANERAGLELKGFAKSVTEYSYILADLMLEERK